MICRYCNRKMFLDDNDRINKYNYDKYYYCENCNTSCIETTRLGIKMHESWHREQGSEVYEEEISFNF